MPPSLKTPTPYGTSQQGRRPRPGRRKFRARGIGEWPVYERDPEVRRNERRWIPWALLATVLFHILIFFGTPGDAFLFESENTPQRQTAYEVQLVEPEPEEMRFIQTNPDVASNEPDETMNFAARDQQAAQETPDPDSESDLPTVEGDNPDSNQIIEGDMEEPVPFSPPPGQQLQPNPAQVTPPPQPLSPNIPEEQAPEAARPEMRAIQEEAPTPPAPDFIEQEPVDEEGPGSTSGPTGEAQERPEEELDRVIPLTAPVPEQPEPIDGRVQPQVQPSEPTEQQDTPEMQTPPEPQGEPSPPTPRPRPRLRPDVVPAPLARSPGSASRQGVLAVDAAFSEFGDYMQRMVEAVSAEWNSQLRQVTLLSERDSWVKVRFTLEYDGRVKSLRVVDKTPNAGLLATSLCTDAIQARSPYDRWTRDMINTLGLDQEITFTFYYR